MKFVCSQSQRDTNEAVHRFVYFKAPSQMEIQKTATPCNFLNSHTSSVFAMYGFLEMNPKGKAI
jgi:hypothetical protein